MTCDFALRLLRLKEDLTDAEMREIHKLVVALEAEG